ncbi:MAG: RagB/SusD family nutrient uptake outer membrane protein [Muribaculaceae bacterium]|nr:RagB/SusD family nutrient uptake outer membrane protein [Muribaculaceae bacterium]
MKRYINAALAALLALPALTLTSCLEDTFPTGSVIQEQVDKADKTYLVNSIPAYLLRYSTDNESYDIGFMCVFQWRDASTADMPIYDNSYDYYSYVSSGNYLGSQYDYVYTIWSRYYGLVQKANLVLQAIDEDNPEDYEAAGIACAFRADAYLEMTQWYEYKPTGFGDLDQRAVDAGVIGMTVPIVTENTTEAESRNNPRVPFYEMYRFILTDLNKGEKFAYGKPEPASKSYAGPGVIYGLQARLWLLMGTRFDMHPEDLATQLSHEEDADIHFDRLGVTTARECFVKAAEYARKAINTGYTPVTESQWFDPKTGFNSSNNAWMWEIAINPNNGLASSMVWQSWVSFMCPEASYGIATQPYNAYRMIESRLFDKISDSDWRKATWIAPSDVADENAYNTKYARGTMLNFNEWSKFSAYCGFKFHAANGSNTISTVGNAVSTPMMRVEEMYLIEAEAIGRSQGEGAGRAALESFVNTYRYTDGSYKSTGAGMEGFIDDVFTQKRIEFWGEGLIFWDYKRLEKAVIKDYPESNFPTQYRVNSLPDHVAPWFNFCIPQSEKNYNDGVILNPNPSKGVYWNPN